MICGLTQFELSAGSNVSMHRIAQAEQGRIVLSDTESNLIVDQLRKHWQWMSGLDPDGTQDFATDFSILTGKAIDELEARFQVHPVMPVGSA